MSSCNICLKRSLVFKEKRGVGEEEQHELKQISVSFLISCKNMFNLGI